jgi:hypothetical protein
MSKQNLIRRNPASKIREFADRLLAELSQLEQPGGEFRALQGGKTSRFNDRVSKFACSGDQVSFQKN